jgi:ABC-type microcin C transport system duplicated ATPase subunit YejF
MKQSPTFYVEKVIMEPLIIHNIGNNTEKEKLVEYMLDKVNLYPAKNYLDKYAHQLSGGQYRDCISKGFDDRASFFSSR